MELSAFGNDKIESLNNYKLKQNVMNVISKLINLDIFRSSFLTDINRLNYLKNNAHYVGLNLSGNNYLVFITNFKNKDTILFIDKKKILSNNYNEIRIYYMDFKSEKWLSDTLLDTKLVLNSKNNKYYLVLNDLYYYKNDSYMQMDLKDKLNIINKEIIEEFKNFPHFIPSVNQIVEYDNISNLILNIIPKLNFNNIGLIFYPKLSGNNILFVEPKIEKANIIQNNTVECNLSPEFILNNSILNLKERLLNRNYNYGDKQFTLRFEKTNITDVYQVYCNNNININNNNNNNNINNNIEIKFIGIANIPNLKTTFMMTELFKNKKYLIMDAVFDENKKKFVPLNASTKKLNNFSQIKNQVKLT